MNKENVSEEASVVIVIPSLGRLSGVVDGDIHVFRGVPFAAPPVRELRFAAPVAPKPWNGVLDATADRAMAPQAVSRVFDALGPFHGAMSEDCLYLTIWAPASAKAAPVMLWIHGGGYSTGAGSQSWFAAQRYARDHGVIVVACNYRLGALGYLSIPGVLDGNYGLLDQMAALRWVNEHIGAFGGDRANVTVFGESAGGHAIASMLAIPSTAGLFQHVILQSPPLGIPPLDKEEVARRAKVFLEELGLRAADADLVEKLRSAPLQSIIDAQGRSAVALQGTNRGDLRPPFNPADAHPYVGNRTEFVEDVARGAVERGVDVMVGWTRNEAALFVGNHPVRQSIKDDALPTLALGLYGDDDPRHLAGARGRRPDADAAGIFEEMIGDSAFRSPSIRLADCIANLGGRAFLYRFDWQSPVEYLRACHCVDLPFTFGAFDAWSESKMLAGVSRSAMEPLAEDMIGRWTQFAKTGNPGFEQWTVSDRKALHFDLPVAAKKVEDIELL